MEKYPKEVGTPEKWPQGADLCYTFGCIMNNGLRDSIQPTYVIGLIYSYFDSIFKALVNYLFLSIYMWLGVIFVLTCDYIIMLFVV